MRISLVVSRHRFGKQPTTVGLFDWYRHLPPAGFPILPPIEVLEEFAAEDHVGYHESSVSWTPFVVTLDAYEDFLATGRGKPARALPTGHERHHFDLAYGLRTPLPWVTDATKFRIWMEELLFGVPHEESLFHEEHRQAKHEAFEARGGGLLQPDDYYPPHKEFHDKHSYFMAPNEPTLPEPPTHHEASVLFHPGDAAEHEILGPGRVEGFVYEHELLKVVVRYACDRRTRYKIPPHIITLAPSDAAPPAVEAPPAAMKYVHGDATQPRGEGAKIIAHVCNDKGGWGKGFVVALGSRFPGAEASYREAWDYRELNKWGLGKTFMAPVDDEIWVAHMIAQHGYRRTKAGPPLRYDALRKCLDTVRDHALDMGASVHMPRIGTGLAGGTWNEIEPIIRTTLADAGVEVTVYDWP